MRSNFHKEIHDIKNELVVARNGLHEEVHDVKNELEATGNSFREEIRDITNDLEGTKNKVLVEIREIKNELKTVSSRFHEEIRGIRNDSEITRGNFLEEIHDIKNELREVKDTFPEEIHAIENGLEATRRNFHSIHETSAYFGSLLSVQTTKGLFIHDLMKPGLDKDSVEFNSSSLHRTVYLSKSKKILSNTMFPLAVAGPGEESLQRYEGAKAVNKVTQGEDLRLKFIVRYEIKKTCRGSAFIFDVTFCDDKFDMFFLRRLFIALFEYVCHM
ncbi:uncharacterized protein PF3D7_1120000-like [Saccostrea echinata]|uniref:uncharacterized protein PF3D7_1120000-like n=1 Tax=Saccostrea echinata TaxID=191078 RepID=UPI002A82E504|nr:uncharacterized protein PF3D7_1120000-like [Saccostrea echinata]